MNGERPAINNEQENNTANNGPWGDSYLKDLPPFNPDQKPDSPETKEQPFSNEDVIAYANKYLQSCINDTQNMINRNNNLNGRAQGFDIDAAKQYINDTKNRLDVWNEVSYAYDDTDLTIPEAFVKLRARYANQAEQLTGDALQRHQEKINAIDSIMSPGGGFANDYDFMVKQMTKDKHRAEVEAQKQERFDKAIDEYVDGLRRQEAESLYNNKPINIDTLIDMGDEDIARHAHAIDVITVSTPGQSDVVEDRLKKVKADYQRTRELRNAERYILEWARDDDNPYCKREDLIARITECRDVYISAQSPTDEIRKNWQQLHKASNRLIDRLEKFDPRLSESLKPEEKSYWDNITGIKTTTKPVPPEQLVPTTLPQDELAKLIGAETFETRKNGHDT